MLRSKLEREGERERGGERGRQGEGERARGREGERGRGRERNNRTKVSIRSIRSMPVISKQSCKTWLTQ